MSIREKLTENIGLKAVSLLLAILLWLIATSEIEGQTVITVPVQYPNLSPGLTLGGKAPSRVELTIVGPRMLLWRAKHDFRAVNLEMHGIGPGYVTFENLQKYSALSSQLRITRTYPSSIVLQVSKLATGAP